MSPGYAPVRVLVTRAAHQASALGDALAARGLLVVSIPTIAIEPPLDDYASLHEELNRLEDHDWILFTSANAVEVFAEQREELGIEEVPCRIASIGESTSRALRKAGLQVNMQPQVAVAEELARVMLPYAPGRRMLLVRAETAREELPRRLQAAGAQVTIATSYRTVVPSGSAAALREEMPRLSAITFASSSAVKNFFDLCAVGDVNVASHVVLASIGPITSATLRECGYSPSLEASVANVEVLASELACYLNAQAL